MILQTLRTKKVLNDNQIQQNSILLPSYCNPLSARTEGPGELSPTLSGPFLWELSLSLQIALFENVLWYYAPDGVIKNEKFL